MPPRPDAEPPGDDLVPPPRFQMRAPCRCGCETGRIERKGAQDVVRCVQCDTYQYCAPRAETGGERRTVRSRPQIKPSQRARILDRDGHRCVLCGRGPLDGVTLHIGHLVSVEEASTVGITDADLWHDENLAAVCDEDNLGYGRTSVSPRLIAALVVHRAKRPGPMADPAQAADLLPRYCAAGLEVFPLHNPIPAPRGASENLWCSCGRPPGSDVGHCPSPAKHPRLGHAHSKNDPARGTCHGECGRPGHGVWDATSDITQVSEWLARWPDANWGVAPPVGVIVLDIDPRNGGDTTLAELEATHGDLPATLTCRTGSGGWHVWLTYRGASRGKLAKGIDVKKRGGYLVAPPSVHMAGGTYEWTDRSKAAHAPVWVRDLLDPPRAPIRLDRAVDGSRSIAGLVRLVAGAAEGERNSRLYWAAIRAHQAGLDTTPLLEAAQSVGTPAFEAANTIESAARAPRREPSGNADRWGWRTSGLR